MSAPTETTYDCLPLPNSDGLPNTLERGDDDDLLLYEYDADEVNLVSIIPKDELLEWLTMAEPLQPGVRVEWRVRGEIRRGTLRDIDGDQAIVKDDDGKLRPFLTKSLSLATGDEPTETDIDAKFSEPPTAAEADHRQTGDDGEATD